MATIKKKRCSACKLTKSVEEFYKKCRASDGLRAECKSCSHEQHRRWYSRNTDRVKSRMRENRKANPTTAKIRDRRDHLKKSYGLTLEEYEEMYVRQKGLCAICRRKVRLNIDHCHKTGKVRGLLCNHCNLMISLFKDSAKRLSNAVTKYLTP